MIDASEIRSSLLDRGVGFHVMRGLYSVQEVDSYRTECERFMRIGTKIRERITTATMPDYVHPRSHDQEQRTARIYQYFHNHSNDAVGRFLQRAMAIRNEVEQAWLGDPVYLSEQKALFDYVIVTQYYGNKGMLAKHQDYSGPAPFPLIQFWVVLSQPDEDYQGGNLVLYSKNGRRRRVEHDLAVRKGDALIFDKSLFHEVELTQIGSKEGALGRWSVLIGARAPCDSFWQAQKKRWLYGPPLYPVLAWGARTLKRLRA